DRGAGAKVCAGLGRHLAAADLLLARETSAVGNDSQCGEPRTCSRAGSAAISDNGRRPDSTGEDAGSRRLGHPARSAAVFDVDGTLVASETWSDGGSDRAAAGVPGRAACAREGDVAERAGRGGTRESRSSVDDYADDRTARDGIAVAWQGRNGVPAPG